MNNPYTTIRTHLGWSQADLAEHLGMTRQAVNLLERGKALPRPPVAWRLIELAEEFELPVSLEHIYPRPAAVEDEAAA